MEKSSSSSLQVGSHDGTGAGDHDIPYRFGRRVCTAAPFPFSTRQFARLLVLRSRMQTLVDDVALETAHPVGPAELEL